MWNAIWLRPILCPIDKMQLPTAELMIFLLHLRYLFCFILHSRVCLCVHGSVLSTQNGRWGGRNCLGWVVSVLCLTVSWKLLAWHAHDDSYIFSPNSTSYFQGCVWHSLLIFLEFNALQKGVKRKLLPYPQFLAKNNAYQLPI